MNAFTSRSQRSAPVAAGGELPCLSVAVRVSRHGGFTLMEITLVIALILGLISFVGFSVTAIKDWQRGKSASIGLQAVFAAQRGYMADHPTADIAGVTTAQLVVYLPEGWSAMPTFTSLEDEALTLDHAVMPPRLWLSAALYDPSGNSTDGLWDIGK